MLILGREHCQRPGIKTTRLRKKAKRMWVVQVGNREEGVKNLFVVRGTENMEITAADGPVILCSVEVSWREKGLMEHIAASGMGADGSLRCWGQAASAAWGELCTRDAQQHRAGGKYRPSSAQPCM